MSVRGARTTAWRAHRDEQGTSWAAQKTEDPFPPFQAGPRTRIRDRRKTQNPINEKIENLSEGQKAKRAKGLFLAARASVKLNSTTSYRASELERDASGYRL